MKKIERGISDVEIEVKKWVKQKAGIIHINEFSRSIKYLKKRFDLGSIMRNPFQLNKDDLTEFYCYSTKIVTIYRFSTSVQRMIRYKEEIDKIEIVMHLALNAGFSTELFNFLNLGPDEALRLIDFHRCIYNQTGVFDLCGFRVDKDCATPNRIEEVFRTVGAIQKLLTGVQDGEIASTDFENFKTEFLKRIDYNDFEKQSFKKGSDEFEVMVDECVKMFDSFSAEKKRKEYIGFWKSFINRYGNNPTVFAQMDLDEQFICMYFVSVGIRSFFKIPDSLKSDFVLFVQHLYKIVHVCKSHIHHKKILDYEKAGIHISIDSINRDLARFERTGYLEFDGRKMIQGVSDQKEIDRTIKELQGFREDLLAIVKSNGHSSPDASINNELGHEKSSKDKVDITTGLNKFTWLGTPAQLAFVTDLLAEKKWLTLTASSEQNAKILLSVMEFKAHAPSQGSLGKCFQKLKKDELPINIDDARKFQKFPARTEL